jgi:hypothetical protein
LAQQLFRSLFMKSPNRARQLGIVAAFGLAMLGGCQSRPTPTPTPTPEPQATSLFVRNFTGEDVVLYAVPRTGQKPVWLTNVPAAGTRSLALKWSDLQANGGLVIRTQIVGRTKTWTSNPLIIDEGIVGVLDLKSDDALTTVGSVLRGVTIQAFGAAMR